MYLKKTVSWQLNSSSKTTVHFRVSLSYLNFRNGLSSLLIITSIDELDFYPPQCIDGVERFATIKITGVTLSDNLRTSTHISKVLETCSRSLCALSAFYALVDYQPMRFTKLPEQQPWRVSCMPLLPGGAWHLPRFYLLNFISCGKHFLILLNLLNF